MNSIKESVHEDFKKIKLDKSQYFNDFYKNNYNLVYRICFSVLKNPENSEDVAQIVFEKIFKMKEEQLPRDHESSWLYTVTKNEALQLIRKTKITEPDDKFDAIQCESNEIDNVADDESYDKIVKKLNKKQEQIVSLKVISDFTFKEIGQIMSMPTATVQWYYYSSIKYLKVALSNFALFLITLVVGLKSMWKSEENDINTVKRKDVQYNKNQEESYTQSDSATSVNSEKKGSINPSQITVCESTTADMGSTNIAKPYWGILSIAGIFLVITIIFSILFVKYKKNNKKYNGK